MIRGIGTSKGIGLGKAVLIETPEIKVEAKKITDIYAEIDRLNDAKKRFIMQAEHAISNLEMKLKDREKTALILKNQVVLVNDIELNDRVMDIIKNDNICAEAAWTKMCEAYEMIFEGMDSEAMNQRATDIKDMKQGVLKKLLGIEEADIGELSENTIIIAYELTPSITACMDTNHVVGIVSEKGGDTSHVAILARSLEIPAVLGIKDICNIVKNDDFVIIDGEHGEVIINPEESVRNEYEKKRDVFIEKTKELRIFAGKDTESKDGKKFQLCANIGGPDDAIKALESGAEGVGLFRTEFLFMNNTSMPLEEEQFEAYRKAAIVLKGRPLTIRTLDIGGDKNLSYMGFSKESNPFLGYRAIRYCLGRKDVFRTQIRAILRASAYGNIRIMIPMVASMDEIRETKRIVNEIKGELEIEKKPYDKNIKIGIMVETPAAAVMADVMAKEVDFFSIGTNDLTQYILAVDRGNENVAYLYSSFDPAVLRIIKNIVASGKNAGIEVGMCGEAAGDERMIPILISFGLDEFSVSLSKILETRKNISEWTIDEANKLTEQVMSKYTEKEVSEFLCKEKEGNNGKNI